MKALSWRSVSGGLVAIAAITVVLVLVLKYARTGALRGEKFRLYVAVPAANNLLQGSDVWLNGQRVGTVAAIEFAPPEAPLEQRVIIAADVLERMRNDIRLDASADLRSGGTIIGAPVVYLSAGTLAARAVVEGDTLRGSAKSDFEIAASRATEALAEVPGIMADARIIVANAKATGARLSAVADENGRSSLFSRGRAISQQLASGSGSAGRLMRDQEIRRRVSSTMAGADSLRALLGLRLEQVGRFRRDSTLARSVRSLRDDVARLRELARSPDGTVGRITTDSALVRGLDSLFVELTVLMADIKKNPLRYARVF